MDVQMNKQIVEEGPRNAVVKLAGTLTTNDITLAGGRSVIALSDFSNNDIRQRLAGFRVDAIMYSMGVQIDALLSWDGDSPQQIVPLSRSGKIDVTGDGGFLPDTTRAGYNGSINIITSGFVPGTQQNFTIVLRLVKLYN